MELAHCSSAEMAARVARVARLLGFVTSPDSLLWLQRLDRFRLLLEYGVPTARLSVPQKQTEPSQLLTACTIDKPTLRHRKDLSWAYQNNAA